MNWSTSQLADAYRRQGSPNPITDACADRPNKFSAQKTEVGGIVFDSKREAFHWSALLIAQQAGMITELERQPVYILAMGFRDRDGGWHRAITYKADFRFLRDGKRIVVDVKGMKTPVYRQKLKMLLAKYPDINFEEWS